MVLEQTLGYCETLHDLTSSYAVRLELGRVLDQILQSYVFTTYALK